LKVKSYVIRVVFRLVTSILRCYEPNEAPIKLPANYSIFPSIDEIPENIKQEIVRGYKYIFSQPPWNEDFWTTEKVIEKLEKEMKGRYSYLVIKKGNKEWPISALHWGAIISIDDLYQRCVDILGEDKQTVLKVKWLQRLIRKKTDEVLFLDDALILPQFRKGGVDRIRFLFLRGLEEARKRKVKNVVFWTTTGTKALPFAITVGFDPIIKINVSGKRIIFLYHPNITALLKLAQNVGSKTIRKLMKLASLI